MNDKKSSIELNFRGRSASMAWSGSRNRATSISNPDKKKVLKSLLDLFLETTAKDTEDKDIEDGAPQLNQKLLDHMESFLSQTAFCYQSYGCPTHTIELNMVKVAKGLGIDAQFLVFPSHTFVEIAGVKTEHGIVKRHNMFFRTSFGYNFYKLQLVDELVRRISSYAQEAEEVVEIQTLDAEVVEEAFTRARAYSTAFCSAMPPMPTQHTLDGRSNRSRLESQEEGIEEENEDDEDDLPVFFNGVESRPTRFDRSQHSSPSNHGYMNPIHAAASREGDDEGDMKERLSGSPPPLFHQLLSNMPKNLSRGSLASEHDREGVSHTKKLGKMILNLARLGPNVYGDEDGDGGSTHNENTYRNLFSKLAVEDGVKLLRAVVRQKSLYTMWFKVLLVGTSSFGACGLFFGGSWTDCLFSLGLGILIGLIELISLVSPTFSRIFEFVATFVASIIIRAVSAHANNVCYRAVLLGTIVFLLQGVTITMSFVDIMTKDLITGSTRLFFGMMISAFIGFGMDMSTSTYASVTGRSYDSVLLDSHCINPISTNWYPVMFLIMAISFNLLLEAHYNQLLQMIVITACSYTVYYFLSTTIGNQVPVIVASFVASCLSNIYSRRTGQPAVVYIIPAIFLLVPGSVAASSFYTVLTLDLSGGLNLTFAVVTGALSVAIGIFGASALLPVPDVEEFFRKASAYPGSNSKKDDMNMRRRTDFNSGLKF